jgi:hypothetical protein
VAQGEDAGILYSCVAQSVARVGRVRMAKNVFAGSSSFPEQAPVPKGSPVRSQG